jgi:hypothetical protein
MSSNTELLNLSANCGALTKSYGNNSKYTLQISKCQFKQLAVVPGGTAPGATINTNYFNVFENIINQGPIVIQPNNTIVLSFVQKNFCKQVDQFVSLIFKFTQIQADNHSVVFSLTFDTASNPANSERYLGQRCLYFINFALLLQQVSVAEIFNR